jgi:5-methyltetrahydropteroyltriglutamate--homocysteine methyltransferase
MVEGVSAISFLPRYDDLQISLAQRTHATASGARVTIPGSAPPAWKYNAVLEESMFTATADLILPSTTTGSFPRPRWFDVSMWGRPLDTCMLDVRFREKFQDAMAVLISDQERAGLDILTHGDLHVDEDLAGRAWHHYPLQRWAGLEGDYLQPEATTAPWLHYPPGTLLNEIYTGWRWPHVVDKIAHRPLD